jgi:hypothetical protein
VSHPIEEVSAGYLLVRPSPRPSWASASLLPDVLVSASECLCPQFPNTSAIDWVKASEESREESLSDVGVPPGSWTEARAWASERFELDFGWPGVFYTIDAARDARSRFFPRDSKVKIVGLGLPSHCVDEFVRYTTPPVPDPGFSPQGVSGSLYCVRRSRPLAAGGRRLGYEPLNVSFGQIACSWICNGLETQCETRLGARPGPNGMLETIELAERCRTEISREETGAEPGLWLPWLLVAYD